MHGGRLNDWQFRNNPVALAARWGQGLHVLRYRTLTGWTFQPVEAVSAQQNEVDQQCENEEERK
jgi:hypothetical protein